MATASKTIGTSTGVSMNSSSPAPNNYTDPQLLERVFTGLEARIGEAENPVPRVQDAARTGIRQVAQRWTDEDGDAEALEQFCLKYFVVEADEHARLRDRLEDAMTTLRGHLYEISRTLRRHSDLVGDDLPLIDGLLATFNPAPDLTDQLYKQKLAFVGLLNFERPSLDAMLEHGPSWTREQWVEARIGRRFGIRIPGEVIAEHREIFHRCSTWVDSFHIEVGNMVDALGNRQFEDGRQLVAHWLVREQIKEGYNLPADQGLERQRALGHVMRRHIDGSLPRDQVSAIGKPRGKGVWNPADNTIDGGPVEEGETVGLARYENWLEHFRMAKVLDSYYLDHPTAIDRKCDLQREIPEPEVERILSDLLESPARADLAEYQSKCVGRPLEAQDIYFAETVPAPAAAEANAALRKRFPDHRAMQAGIPEILREIGFSDDDADFLGSRVQVEIAKGPGHAVPPGRLEYSAWLRTNSLDDQLGWDGFDIAMHELGHNIEQLCSRHYVDRPILSGVPNNACTEAFAFLFQSMSRRMAGLEDEGQNQQKRKDAETVATGLRACQIAGAGLLELEVWRWLYANPDADAAALRHQVLERSNELWARYYAPYYGANHYHLLAAYQHMIGFPLYLPDYTIGHVITHQIRSYIGDGDIAAETKRICSIGRLTPDQWMREAVGAGIDAKVLMADAKAAVGRL